MERRGNGNGRGNNSPFESEGMVGLIVRAKHDKEVATLRDDNWKGRKFNRAITLYIPLLFCTVPALSTLIFRRDYY